MFRYEPSATTTLDGYLHLNGILLGSILTDFYREYHRNYNWGMGFSIKAGVDMKLFGDKLFIRLANQHYEIYTSNNYSQDYDWSLTPEGRPVDIQGDASHASFNHFEASVNYRLWKRLYLTGGIDYYRRKTTYNDMTIKYENSIINTPIIESKQLGFHLMLSYKI